MNKTKIAKIVANLQSPDFWTAVPVPTVAGEKTALFEPFIYKIHYFTKTGSGQT